MMKTLELVALESTVGAAWLLGLVATGFRPVIVTLGLMVLLMALR
jgi:hypothetical protein